MEDTVRKEKPSVKMVDEAKLKQQAYEERKAEREKIRRAEKAKAKAEKLALITCIETLVSGIKGELSQED